MTSCLFYLFIFCYEQWQTLVWVSYLLVILDETPRTLSVPNIFQLQVRLSHHNYIHANQLIFVFLLIPTLSLF